MFDPIPDEQPASNRASRWTRGSFPQWDWNSRSRHRICVSSPCANQSADPGAGPGRGLGIPRNGTFSGAHECPGNRVRYRSTLTVLAGLLGLWILVGSGCGVAPQSESAGLGNAARGARLFASLPCHLCHDVTRPLPGGAFCPNLGNIATEAERIIHQPDYHGAATTAAAYIRESILDPNAYIVPGPAYRDANGRSLMPADFGERLTPAELDDLVAFLLTRR